MKETVQLPHLETFVAAAELSSFTAAAKALQLSQAAVSQRIQHLETILNQGLFQRQGKQILLTAAGHQLYEYAQRILELHQEARDRIAGHQTPLTGELSLAASSIPGEHLLPALLSEFRRRYPHIQVRAAISDSLTVLEDVERGRVCLGLVGRKLDNPHLQFDFLAKDRMLLIVPPGHALAKRRQISVREMSGHSVILREPGSGLRHCFEKALENANHSLRDLDVCLELGSNEAIKEAVIRGAGVAVISAYAVQKELKSGALLGVRIRDLQCDRDMYVVQDQRRVLPLPGRQFLLFLETHPFADDVP